MIDLDRRAVVLGAAALASNLLVPYSGFSDDRAPLILGPKESTKIDGFNITNRSEKITYLAYQKQVDEIKKLSDGTLREILLKNNLSININDQNLFLYMDVFGERLFRSKRIQSGTFDENLEIYKRSSGFYRIAEFGPTFYEENKSALLKAEDLMGVPS